MALAPKIAKTRSWKPRIPAGLAWWHAWPRNYQIRRKRIFVSYDSRKRIFVSWETNFRFQETKIRGRPVRPHTGSRWSRYCDWPKYSWGQTRVCPQVILLASRMIARTSRRNALILSMPSNSGRIMALLRGSMLVIILIIPPRGHQVVTTNSYDWLITCEFVCVNLHVSIRIISAWTAQPHRGLFVPSRNYKFVWLIDYIRIRMWFFFFLFSFFLFFFFATMFALP